MLELSTSGLSELQSKFVEAYARTGEVRPSAEEAGYSHPEMGYQALRSLAVQKALRDHQDRRVRIEGGTLGVNEMIRLVKNSKSDAIRFQAAKYLMDAAGYGPKTTPHDGKAKPLSEMTEDELAKTVDRLKAQAAEPYHPETGHIPPLASGETQLEQQPV